MKSTEEIVRFIHGLQKKHGDDFEIVVKYESETGKTRRRHGRFLGLQEDRRLGLVETPLPPGRSAMALRRMSDRWM